MRKKGKVTTWNDERGFGFITPAGGSDRVFLHVSALVRGNRRPKVNDLVSYDFSTDKDGRACAAEVTLQGPEFAPRASGRRWTAVLVALLFLTGLVGLSDAGVLHRHISHAYLAMSALTLVLYGVDKGLAQLGSWRISETALHSVGLLGGWPGAILGQEFIRHKSRKRSFRVRFWATVVLNCAAIAWFSTDQGRLLVQNVLAGF